MCRWYFEHPRALHQAVSRLRIRSSVAERRLRYYERWLPIRRWDERFNVHVWGSAIWPHAEAWYIVSLRSICIVWFKDLKVWDTERHRRVCIHISWISHWMFESPNRSNGHFNLALLPPYWGSNVWMFKQGEQCDCLCGGGLHPPRLISPDHWCHHRFQSELRFEFEFELAGVSRARRKRHDARQPDHAQVGLNFQMPGYFQVPIVLDLGSWRLGKLEIS